MTEFSPAVRVVADPAVPRGVHWIIGIDGETLRYEVIRPILELEGMVREIRMNPFDAADFHQWRAERRR